MDTYLNGHTGVLELLGDEERDEGFSLIELIVVVLVIGIIAAIAIPVFLNAQDNARQSAVEESAHAGLTTATAALLQGENAEDLRVSEVSDQNDDINIELIAGGVGSFDVDELCVQASYVGNDNTATAGIACEGESGDGGDGPGNGDETTPPEGEDEAEAIPHSVRLNVQIRLQDMPNTEYHLLVENLNSGEVVREEHKVLNGHGYSNNNILHRFDVPEDEEFEADDYRVRLTLDGQETLDYLLPGSEVVLSYVAANGTHMYVFEGGSSFHIDDHSNGGLVYEDSREPLTPYSD